MAGIIANEMGVNLKVTSGPAIEKPGEIAAILNSLQENDVLFVDEIHRLNRQVEEVLYPAMEDYAIDIMIGKGASARSVSYTHLDVYKRQLQNKVKRNLAKKGKKVPETAGCAAGCGSCGNRSACGGHMLSSETEKNDKE